jgi:hypothetical protein
MRLLSCSRRMTTHHLQARHSRLELGQPSSRGLTSVSCAAVVGREPFRNITRRVGGMILLSRVHRRRLAGGPTVGV